MKKILTLITIACVAIVAITSCTSEIYQSTLQTTAFKEKIDSSDMETLRFYDSKSKLQYTITNDMQNLYVCIKAVEEQTQFKIIRAGMQLTIGNISKANPQATIQYPLAMGMQMNPNGNQASKQGIGAQRPDINSLKLQFKSKYQEMHLLGFSPQVGNVLPLHNEKGLNITFDWDANNTLYYKAIIPFKTFYKDKLDLSDTARVFDISFVINAIKMPSQSDANSGMGPGAPETGMNNGRMGGGGMSGGRMGGGGGGRHGGGGGNYGGGQNHSEMAEVNKVKFKLQLVVNKN